MKHKTRHMLKIHACYLKSVLIITDKISYQFETLQQRIDAEFHCGSPGIFVCFLLFFNEYSKIMLFSKAKFSQNRMFPARHIGCGCGEAAATEKIFYRIYRVDRT